MKKYWAPILLLAAGSPAQALPPVSEAECDVLVTVIEDRALPRDWEGEMALKLETLGFDPEWTCVMVPDTESLGVKGAILTKSNIGTLEADCQSTPDRDECEWSFEKAETVSSSDSEMVHVQFHGSDFNASRKLSNEGGS